MAYINPSTNIVLIKNCILQKSVNDETDTLFFESKTDQDTYFDSLGNKKIYAPATYQNIKQGTLRIGAKMSEIYGCNYMYFDNGADYENKRYYCFVDEIKYINSNCTEVYYSIDYIQTFMFDFTEKTCYVERMTTSDDIIGNYTLEENLDLGTELKVHNKHTYFFNTWRYIPLYGSKTSLPSHSVKIGDNTVSKTGVYMGQKFIDNHIRPYWYFEFIFDSVLALLNGTYPFPCYPCTGVIVYSVDSVDGDTVRISNPTTIYFTDTISRTMPDSDITMNGKEVFAYLYQSGYVSDLNGRFASDNAVSDYMAMLNPLLSTYFMPNSFTQNNYYVSADEVIQVAKPTKTGGISSLDGYRPKNNKLFTYPYVQLTLSSSDNEVNTFRYEWFQAGEKCSFNVRASGLPTPVCTMFPNNYNSHGGNAMELGMSLTNFQQIPMQIESYKEYLYKNRYRDIMGIANAILQTGSVVKAVASKDVMGATSGGLSVFQQIQEITQRQNEAKIQPNRTIGQLGCVDLNMANGTVGYIVYEMCVDSQHAKVIDDFFTRYGYKISTNVNLSGQRNIRPYFTFIKTVECNLSINNSMYQEDEKAIEEIYNRGIRYWNNPQYYKDYRVDNSF
jgi:hypothetical protein